MLDIIEDDIAPSSLSPAAELAFSQVEALFSDVRSFAIGGGGVCMAALAVSWRTGSIAVYLVAVALLAILIARLFLMSLFAKKSLDQQKRIVLSRWEYYYHFGAAAHIGAIGVFCLTIFIVTTNPLDRMLGMATLLAYMAGIPGRNFANRFGVNLQIFVGAVPLLVSMAVAGKEYWLLTCILFMPYFFGLKGLASRLRGVFVQATMRAHELSALASRFDTALNNMSHGLAMFAASGQIIVYNERLLELLLLDPSVSYFGRSIAALLTQLSDVETERLESLKSSVAHPSRDPVEIRMRDSSFLELSFQPMLQGGAVVLVQDITERKRAVARINQLALFDELTDLANRAHFRTLLVARLEQNPAGVKQALMFIDLDQFKQVNDTLGHSSGDCLIRQVADRIRATAGDNIVARLGGDEFVVLHQFSGSLSHAEEAAEDLIVEISQPYDIGGHNVFIGASIGIAVFPEHDLSPDQLLKKADLALYRAKADGRGSCRVFEPAIGAQAQARIDLEFDLRQALSNDEFELFYQPIFNLRENRVSVCEALLRWRHPRRGLVPPDEFIPVAEEMGLIVDIGKWVLERACADCRAWPKDVRVAVNISPTQFRRDDIVTSVSNALDLAGLEPSRLELEITESVLLQDIAFTSLTIRMLHIKQVTISLDDFGTGYSSLSYLNKLPLSKVKIDRSFLVGLGTNHKSMLMLRGLIRLSTELGLSIVIEGVESESQLQLVKTFGDVQEIQGFLLSRPVPFHDVCALIAKRGGLLEPPESRRLLAAS